MRERLRTVVELDNVVPLVLIVGAVLISLDPAVFGAELSERSIVLAFFGFLGADALIERTGRLSRVERRVNDLAGELRHTHSAGEVLRQRSAFERMDVLAGRARKSVLIIGVNLEGALGALPALCALARAGGTIRLLALDPDGDTLAPAAVMSGVDPDVRRAKIVQNLELLRAELETLLDPDARARVRLLVADRILPLGALGIDEATAGGQLIVQHYLTGTVAELAPLMRLRADADEPWYGRYLAQCVACLAGAREWDGARV
jgi:hypothetical protein